MGDVCTSCRSENMRAVFIHTQRRGKNAAPDKRNAGQFDQPLNRSVLSVFSVQYGESQINGNRFGFAFPQQ